MKLTEIRTVGALSVSRTVECGDELQPFARDAVLAWLRGDWPPLEPSVPHPTPEPHA